MKLTKVTRAPIVVTVDGARLEFEAASHQDSLYARNIIKNDVGVIVPFEERHNIKHVFSKLINIEGVSYEDKPVTVDQMKRDCLEFGERAIRLIVGEWAMAVLRANGLLSAEADEKKAQAQPDSTVS